MAYRKIVVDGAEYKYVVGRTHVKIHGQQAVPLDQIAAKVHGDRWSVTPLRVAIYIQLGHVPADTPAPNILAEETTARMKRIAQDGTHQGDYAQCHRAADALLCNLLVELGYSDLVKAFDQVPKWYA